MDQGLGYRVQFRQGLADGILAQGMALGEGGEQGDAGLTTTPGLNAEIEATRASCGRSLIINLSDHKDEGRQGCTDIWKMNQRIIKKCMFWRTVKLYDHAFQYGLKFMFCENV